MAQLHLPASTVGFSDGVIDIEPTMSSREIAELVGSRHDDVKRSIVRLADRGTIQLPPLADVKNHLGQTVQEYKIGKRDTFVIVAQLSPEFTARLVDRWQELEADLAARPSIDPVAMLNDPATLQRLLLDNVSKVVSLQERVAELEPKAAFHDAISSAVNARKIAVIAQEVGTGEKRLFAWLRWVGRLTLASMPAQRYLDLGHFIVEPDTWRDPQGGKHAYSRVLVTGKGLISIQQNFSEEVAKRALRYEREVKRGRAPADVLRELAAEADRKKVKP